PYYLDALARYRVAYLEGYTSSLYALAQEALHLGRRDLQVAVAIPNAEPVEDYQRQAIAAAFGCSVRETYGMAESVAAHSECPSDSRRFGRLVPVFKADLPVHEAQIVQDTLRRVRIRYVPTANFTPEAARTLVERLQARMGNVAVVLEPVAEIPRTAAGKFRAVVCNVPPEERATLNTLAYAHADLPPRT